MICPKCGSQQVVKNGSIHNNKPKFKCKSCECKFVDDPKNQPISDSTKQLIDKLFETRISLAGICRVTGVSEKWLYNYIITKYAKTLRALQVKPKKKGKLIGKQDELWAEVDNKANKQWERKSY